MSDQVNAPSMQGARSTLSPFGHAQFDMQAYIDYFAGKLQGLDYGEAGFAMVPTGLPSVPKPA